MGDSPTWGTAPTCTGLGLEVPSCHHTVPVGKRWGTLAGGCTGGRVQVAASPIAAEALRAGTGPAGSATSQTLPCGMGVHDAGGRLCFLEPRCFACYPMQSCARMLALTRCIAGAGAGIAAHGVGAGEVPLACHLLRTLVDICSAMQSGTGQNPTRPQCSFP